MLGFFGIVWDIFITSLRKDIILFKFDGFGQRVLIIHVHDQFAVEDIKLLTTIYSYGNTKRPYQSE